MQTSQSFGIHFTTRADKARDGRHPVYACVTVNRQRAYIALKQNVDPKNWDAIKGSGKGNREEIKALNHHLEEVRMALGNCYKQIQLKGKFLSAKTIKDLFLNEDQEEAFTLSRLHAYHNETAEGALKSSTLEHYRVTQRYLMKFVEVKYQNKDIYLHELNFKFVQDFEVFLRQHRPADHQQPINHNGIMKHIVRLKKMINMAVNLDWIDKDPFSGYRVKIHKVTRGQLSEKELADMESKIFEIERLNMVRDLFVFCCYTGLSYIDVSQLTPANISEDNGDYWLSTCREKTSVPVNFPLLPKALEILDKYKDNDRALANGKLFPVISNQKVNSYLKEIADLCKIKKNITFHLARHTFATTVTLCNGVPIETVSKILGHTKIATTQIYAKVVEKKLKEDMLNLRKRLDK